MAGVGRTPSLVVAGVAAMASSASRRQTLDVLFAGVRARAAASRSIAPFRPLYANWATGARARVAVKERGYDDKMSLQEPWPLWVSVECETQVPGVLEVLGEWGVDSAGQAGVRSRK